MIDNTEVLIREVARMVGNEVAKISQFAIDRTQDLSLTLLQRAATNSPGNGICQDALAKSSTALSQLSQVSVIVPLIAGRVAAGSTYLALRVGTEVVNRAQKVITGRASS